MKQRVSEVKSECNHSPPGALNVALALSLMTGWVALLWWADQQAHWAAKAGIGILFAFLGLTVYALLHEALHRHLHACQVVNDFFGTMLAAAYGGGLPAVRRGTGRTAIPGSEEAGAAAPLQAEQEQNGP